MKKFKKLLVYCITLATVMSAMVIPMEVCAEVSQTNLFGALPVADGAFVSGKSAGGEVAVESTDAAWQKINTAEITEENGYISVNNTAPGAGIRYNYAKAEPKKTYLISAYVKLAEEGTANASISASIANSTFNSLPAPASTAPAVAISADKWTYVYGEYKYGAALTGKGTGDHAEQDRRLRGSHYEIKVDTACAYYLKDIQMIDVTSGKNLLHSANPGFESGIIDTSTASKQNGTFAIVSDDAHTGTYSTKGTASGSINDIRYVNYQITKDQWYRATVYVKSNTPNAKACLVVQQAGTSTNVKGSEISLTGGWDKIEIEFMGSDKFTKVHFGPVITKGAEVYVDDFCLEEFIPADKNLADSAVVNDASGTLTAENGEYTTTSTMIRPVNIGVEVGATYVYSAKVKINSETPQNVEATIGFSGSNKNCIAAEFRYSDSKSVGNEYEEVYGIVKIGTRAPVDSNEDGVYESGWVDANNDGIPDKLDTNKDGIPETQPTTKAHFQFATDTAVSMSAKDIQIRKLTPFDINKDYIGKVINDEEKIKLYLNGPESTVWLFAASYGEGDNIESVIMDKVVLNADNKCCGKLELIKNDNYRYFIWDGNLRPLNTVYTLAN